MAATTRPSRKRPRDAAMQVSSKEVGGELAQQRRGQPGDIRDSDHPKTYDPRSNLGPAVQRLERLLTVGQLAEIWQLSERTIRRMISDGRLPVIRLGRAVRIPTNAGST